MSPDINRGQKMPKKITRGTGPRQKPAVCTGDFSDPMRALRKDAITNEGFVPLNNQTLRQSYPCLEMLKSAVINYAMHKTTPTSKEQETIFQNFQELNLAALKARKKEPKNYPGGKEMHRDIIEARDWAAHTLDLLALCGAITLHGPVKLIVDKYVENFKGAFRN